jgi:hypothetical protein
MDIFSNNDVKAPNIPWSSPARDLHRFISINSCSWANFVHYILDDHGPNGEKNAPGYRDHIAAIRQDMLTSYFWSGDAIRSRRVSDIVLSGTVDVPEPSPRLLADWKREISSRTILEAGDVEPMPFARAGTLAGICSLRAGSCRMDMYARTARGTRSQ